MRKVKSIHVSIEREGGMSAYALAKSDPRRWEMTTTVRLEKDNANPHTQSTQMECVAVLHPDILEPGFEAIWRQAQEEILRAIEKVMEGGM